MYSDGWGADAKLEQTKSLGFALNHKAVRIQCMVHVLSLLNKAPMFPRYTAYVSSHVFLGLAVVALVKGWPIYIVSGQMLQYVLSLLCWATPFSRIVNADRTCALINIITLVAFYLNQGISSGMILLALSLTLGFKIMDYVHYRPEGEATAVTSWYLLWHFNLGCNNALLMTLKHALPWEAFACQYAVAFALPLLLSSNGATKASCQSSTAPLL